MKYPHGTCLWSPGQSEVHLHGFASQADRDAYMRGEPGPFERVLRRAEKMNAQWILLRKMGLFVPDTVWGLLRSDWLEVARPSPNHHPHEPVEVISHPTWFHLLANVSDCNREALCWGLLEAFKTRKTHGQGHVSLAPVEVFVQEDFKASEKTIQLLQKAFSLLGYIQHAKPTTSCNLFAHQRTHHFEDFFRSREAVQMRGSGPIVPVRVSEDPNGSYYGWWCAWDELYTTIFRSPKLLDECFPSGFMEAEKLNQGRMVRLRVELRTTDS